MFVDPRIILALFLYIIICVGFWIRVYECRRLSREYESNLQEIEILVSKDLK
jgi:hypothetical protein